MCLSDCPYMFAAGIGRWLDDPVRLGVHQHSFRQSFLQPAFLPVEDIQKGQAEVLERLDDFGVGPRIRGSAMTIPANEVNALAPDELQDWIVTMNGGDHVLRPVQRGQ